jgi:peptide-methionine (R)-S-oxide reductase
MRSGPLSRLGAAAGFLLLLLPGAARGGFAGCCQQQSAAGTVGRGGAVGRGTASLGGRIVILLDPRTRTSVSDANAASSKRGDCGSIASSRQPRRTLLLPALLLANKPSSSSEVDGSEDVLTTAALFEGRTRRSWLVRSVPRALSLAIVALGGVALGSRRPAWAGGSGAKSRTDSYCVRKPEDDWKDVLSPMQYFVLREGGTERPYYSVLEGENRPGTYICAGCGTPLFDGKDKFHSGTGWPSFARALPGVEIQPVDPISQRLLGAELRCQTCGGHLGDVFSDGSLFVGTEAAKTGQRFCIDGAALLFYPEVNAGGNELPPVRGDEMSAQMKRKKKRTA